MLRLKQNTLDGITVVMASCQTSIVPSCSRIAEVLYRVQKVALFKAGRGQTNNARQDYCAYGQLPDLVSSQMEQNKSNSTQCYHGHGQLPDNQHAEEKIRKPNTYTVVMASC